MNKIIKYISVLSFLALAFVTSLEGQCDSGIVSVVDSSSNHLYGGAERLHWRRQGIARAWKNIWDGNPQRAVDSMNVWRDAGRKDAWIHYSLAIGFAHVGEPDSAIAHVDSTTANGLPFGQFLVHAPNMLKPLWDIPGFQTRKTLNDVKILGLPLLGDLTDRTASWAVHFPDSGEAKILVYPVGQLDTSYVFGYASHLTGNVAKFHIRTLRPNTTYEYQVEFKGERLGGSYQFRSFPPNDSAGTLKVMQASCSQFHPWWEDRSWQMVADEAPDIFINIGDNVYIDRREVELKRMHWAQRLQQPCFALQFCSTPYLSVYDDHEWQTNDALPGLLDKVDRDSQYVSWYWTIPNYNEGTPQFPGCYYRLKWNKVEAFFLDGRYYRNQGETTDEDPSRQMLGTYQRETILKWLNESTADFKVIVNPVPINRGNQDKWKGYKWERDAFFGNMFEDSLYVGEYHNINLDTITGVFAITGDEHYFLVDAVGGGLGNPYPLYEFLAGRYQNTSTENRVTEGPPIFAEDAYNGYQILEFDTSLADPQVKMTFRAWDGSDPNQTVFDIFTITLDKSDLQP